LIKSQESEISAAGFVLIDAGVVFKELTLELSGSVIEFLIVSTWNWFGCCGALAAICARFAFSVVFNTTTLSYVHSGKDNRKCKSSAYGSKSSTTAKPVPSADDEKLDYGSAKLQGKLFEDNTCIDQNKTSCTDFRFLALYQADGLDDVDGILGLAVHPDAKRRNLNYVW
jgi:hypothetical protein